MELVVVIAILGIFALFSTGLISVSAQTFNLVNLNTTQHWEVRKAMQTLKHDIQMMDSQTLDSWGHGSGGYGYRNGWEDKLGFRTVDNVLIKYRLVSPGTLERQVSGGGWSTLIENLNYFPFQYQDVNSNTTTTIANLAFIEVDLDRTVDSNNFQLLEKFYVRN